MSLCLHKGLAKLVVKEAGVPTPRSLTVQSLADLQDVSLQYPLFAKPLAEGTGKGISADSRIADPPQLHRVCERLLGQFRQPVLVEEFLPGRELTVGLLGTGTVCRSPGDIGNHPATGRRTGCLLLRQ